MTNHFLSHSRARLAIVFSFFWIFTINTVSAGICDISGGSGIGGTGAPMHGSGIGGTGAIANGRGIGIGGTGNPIKKTGSGLGGTGFVINGSGIGGTGQSVDHNGIVVGTITGFGSICVNGIEIHYTSDTPLQRDGQSVSPENSLAIGQVVAVDVLGLGNEVTAKEMHILHAVTGPISTIDFVKGEIEVVGQKVHFDINSASSPKLNSLQSGDYIEVSGLRDQLGNIIASRIDAIATQGTASLRGLVTAVANNSFVVQGIPVNVTAPPQVSIGQNVHITGILDNNGFKADGLVVNPQQLVSADIGGLISIEGYLDSSDNSARIEVAGRIIEIPRELRAEVEQISNHERVIVTGRLAEGSIIQMEHMLIDFPTADLENTISATNEHLDNKDDRKEDNDHRDIDKHETEQDKGDDHQELESLENKEDDKDEIALPQFSDHDESDTLEYETSELEAPEIHEPEAPEIPEFEAPEVSENEAPEMPEFEAPEVPEYEAPEMPEYETPEVPEFEDHDY